MLGSTSLRGCEVTAPSEAEVRDRINTVGDPCSAAHGTPLGLEDMGLVEAVDIAADGGVQVRLD